jgi:hypothetical protein
VDHGWLGKCEVCSYDISRVGKADPQGSASDIDERIPCPKPYDCPGQLPLL